MTLDAGATAIFEASASGSLAGGLTWRHGASLSNFRRHARSQIDAWPPLATLSNGRLRFQLPSLNLMLHRLRSPANPATAAIPAIPDIPDIPDIPAIPTSTTLPLQYRLPRAPAHATTRRATGVSQICWPTLNRGHRCVGATTMHAQRLRVGSHACRLTTTGGPTTAVS